jgi:type IV secretory pathway VirB3-like protein
MMYFIHSFLIDFINIEVHCVGYLYIMDLSNVRKTIILKYSNRHVHIV